MIKTEYENPLIKDAEKYPESLFLFSKVKGSSVLNGRKAKDIKEMTFKDVQFIKDTLENPKELDMLKVITLVFGFKDFKRLKLLEFYKAYNYIVEQVKAILDLEKMLVSEPNEKLIAAGIESMSIFGALNILDDIAKRYATPPMEVELWSYNWIFSLSLKIKRENDIQTNLNNNEN